MSATNINTPPTEHSVPLITEAEYLPLKFNNEAMNANIEQYDVKCQILIEFLIRSPIADALTKIREKIRECLELPLNQDYEEAPEKEDMFEQLDAVMGCKAKISKINEFKRNKLPAFWQVLMEILNKCLSSKIGGFRKSDFDVPILSESMMLLIPKDSPYRAEYLRMLSKQAETKEGFENVSPKEHDAQESSTPRMEQQGESNPHPADKDVNMSPVAEEHHAEDSQMGETGEQHSKLNLLHFSESDSDESIQGKSEILHKGTVSTKQYKQTEENNAALKTIQKSAENKESSSEIEKALKELRDIKKKMIEVATAGERSSSGKILKEIQLLRANNNNMTEAFEKLLMELTAQRNKESQEFQKMKKQEETNTQALTNIHLLVKRLQYNVATLAKVDLHELKAPIPQEKQAKGYSNQTLKYIRNFINEKQEQLKKKGKNNEKLRKTIEDCIENWMEARGWYKSMYKETQKAIDHKKKLKPGDKYRGGVKIN
ncbi:uncharacterized protein LOC110919438 [Helianthus annuus]|uniref:uncharacterized protein LOC110919438 n=1 Tax=Helianthus annuus TaxID=4232 RepID=UPI000B8F11C3|nr:uncharacterized protein LOC110919438 [Helianthus annuus]